MTPDSETLLAVLRQHRTLGSAPEEELRWLVGHATYRLIRAGEYILRTGQQVNELAIVLSGRFGIHVDSGGGRRKVTEWRDGDVAGLLPYSRLVTSPGSTLVEEETTALMVDSAHFPELIRVCPVSTAIMVHVMLDRARLFSSDGWQDEKMVSLGKLSAGLAHELNNPASAAASSARQLDVALEASEHAARALARFRLTDVQLNAIDEVHAICRASASQLFRSPLQRADREEEFTEWLASHGADPSAAATLADTPAEIDTLDLLGATMDGPALDAAIRWIASGCLTHSLATEVHRASARVHDLVAALKRHTYMDRAIGGETVDVVPGIVDAVTVLGAKARSKGVTVSLSTEPDVPAVWGNGGELNQIWANLLDNAIDAAATSQPGLVDVSVRRETRWVVVRVVDNGPGIPPELHRKVFDTFFTTKPVGQGTGLGLDIAQRAARRYSGSIEFDTMPGRTEFRVRFPIPGVSSSMPALRR